MENEKATQQELDEIIEQAHQSQAERHGYYNAHQSPREYLHSFLLQAKHAGCNVDNYINDEIITLLAELKR